MKFRQGPALLTAALPSLLLSVLLLPARVKAPPIASTCELTVKARKDIKGACDIELERDGSFTLRQMLKDQLTWFAVDSSSGKDIADGF